MPTMGVDERRARLAVRHRLAVGAQTPLDVARSVLALHATDPSTVFLSIWARMASVGIPDIERALYDERSLLRMLGMRRTMFVVPTEDAPMIQSSCTDAIAVQLRRRYVQLLTDTGTADAPFFDEVTESTAEALLARGEATATQLSTDEPRLRTSIRLNEGKAYGGEQNITSWVMLLLAAQGRAVRGRPRGSWTSTQWTWSAVQAWLPGGMQPFPPAQARVELVRRWLGVFGPATVADLKWWTGWTLGEVRRALGEVAPVEVDIGDATGLILADDLEHTPTADETWIALLPALDPTPMGWADRSWFLGPHGTALFDRSGNIGPTVWSQGRIIGGWAQRRDGDVVFRLLEAVDPAVTRAVAAAAGKLAQWIGPVRVTPRFRTPLERELTA
jgi:hypothetical protein